MKNNILEEKSKKIALKVITIAKKISNKDNYILANQFLRSGTSIGANICESTYAVSRADFIYKLQISQKEANETKYWLELLFESNIIDEDDYSLIKEVKEIITILSKSIITTKKNNNF